MTFKPGKSGNPEGRPKGSRNKTTIAVETLLDADADAITKKTIELAKGGDLTAIRICMDRIAPARKDRPVPFAIPKLEKASDAVMASAAIVGAVATGDLTPSEAAELSKVVDGYTRTLEAADFEQRLAKLESAVKNDRLGH